MMLIAACLLACFQQFAVADENWGYVYDNRSSSLELDPAHWAQIYANCMGSRQSPIDVEKDYVQFDPTLQPLIFSGYNTLIKTVTVTNEGHTVRIDVPDSATAYVTSRSMNKAYKLKQFHFHWGHTDATGSEHTVFGQQFPLEMHLVHYDASVTYNQALTEGLGLLVISVLFKFGAVNSELNRLTNHFNAISNPLIRTVTTLPNLDPMLLIPKNTVNYLTYAGSLTTPPCNEAVQWIILTQNQEISHAQMNNFRALKKETLVNGLPVVAQLEVNDRTLQAINGRKVSLYYNFDGLAPPV